MIPSAFRHSEVLPVAPAQSLRRTPATLGRRGYEAGLGDLRRRLRRTLSRRRMESRWLATGLVLLLATLAHSQNSQFMFDATGNLFAQVSETLALPQIIGQPQMQVVIPGDSASFSVLLAGLYKLVQAKRNKSPVRIG
jgi:hypothetical protein